MYTVALGDVHAYVNTAMASDIYVESAPTASRSIIKPNCLRSLSDLCSNIPFNKPWLLSTTRFSSVLTIPNTSEQPNYPPRTDVGPDNGKLITIICSPLQTMYAYIFGKFNSRSSITILTSHFVLLTFRLMVWIAVLPSTWYLSRYQLCLKMLPLVCSHILLLKCIAYQTWKHLWNIIHCKPRLLHEIQFLHPRPSISVK